MKNLLKIWPLLIIALAVTVSVAWPQGAGVPSGGGGSGTVNSGTNGDLASYAGTGTTVGDSGVVAANVIATGLSTTQTLQCTGNITCLILKQSAGGGDPLIIQSSGGTAQFTIQPGASFPVVSNQALAAFALGNNANSHTWISSTAPTIAAAGCGGSAASISSNNGTAAFKVNVGTTNTGTCTVTMPAATTDWVCSANDNTTKSANVFYTAAVPGGTPTTQISLQNYTDAAATHAWTDSDIIEVSCFGE